MVKHNDFNSCARRLAVAKVLGALILSTSELAIQFDAAQALAIRFQGVWTGSMVRQKSKNDVWTVTHGASKLPSRVGECMQELTKLCRAAGGIRLCDLCSDCRPSVQNLCIKCAYDCDKGWAETRDRGYSGLPLWDTMPAEQYFNEDNPHHSKLLALANGNLMAGTDTKTLGKLHFSDPSNACVDDWNEGDGYLTWGQIGESMLKSIPDLCMAADLLHTVKDVQFTLIQLNVMCLLRTRSVHKSFSLSVPLYYTPMLGAGSRTAAMSSTS